MLTQYSELGRDSGDERQHTIEEVCDLQSMFWISSDHTYSASPDPTTVISPAVQCRLVELHRLEARIREEKQLLIAESIQRVDVYRTKLELFRSQSSLCAGDVAMVVINSQWLELQLYETELTNKALIEAYWSNALQAEAILLTAKKQCKQGIVLPTHPLYMDSSPQAYFALSPDEDINTDEASTDETESMSSVSASSSDLELSM